MTAVRRTGSFVAAIGGFGIAAFAISWAILGPPREAKAGWIWHGKRQNPPCGHAGCSLTRCLAPAGWGGQWYWMRSPDQQHRVVMGLYNRFCIRCHGVDGRGVWDIPDVPDFTDPRWQGSRPDPQIVNILMEGRGAVMPSFRGTLTLEESWAMAHYLRSFVPGTEASRPEVGRSSPTRPGAGAAVELPPLPATTR